MAACPPPSNQDRNQFNPHTYNSKTGGVTSGFLAVNMNMLAQAGLEYDVVRDELEAQIDRLGDDQFATFANEDLIEADERYG